MPQPKHPKKPARYGWEFWLGVVFGTILFLGLHDAIFGEPPAPQLQEANRP